MLYSVAIHQFESPGPVEQWRKIGFELRRLRELKAGKMLMPDEYKSARQRLLQKEDAIASASEFPGDMTELARYEKARANSPTWPFAFWIAFAGSVMTAIATASWLQGASFAASEASSVTEDLP